MIEDLIAALKNALERGETVEEAKISLLNAGYKKEEIEKAAQVIKSRIRKGIPKPKSFPLPPKKLE